MAKLKEDKVNDLLGELDTNMRSTENQLSCYKCMSLLVEPVILSPCTHVVCKACVRDNGDKCCPQCSREFKKVLGPS